MGLSINHPVRGHGLLHERLDHLRLETPAGGPSLHSASHLRWRRRDQQRLWPARTGLHVETVGIETPATMSPTWSARLRPNSIQPIMATIPPWCCPEATARPLTGPGRGRQDRLAQRLDKGPGGFPGGGAGSGATVCLRHTRRAPGLTVRPLSATAIFSSLGGRARAIWATTRAELDGST